MVLHDHVLLNVLNKIHVLVGIRSTLSSKVGNGPKKG